MKLPTILGHDLIAIKDPVQTHAIYQLSKSEFPKVKAELKRLGATDFRKIVANKLTGESILCFKLEL